MKEKLVNQWLNEDFKWSRPQSPAYTNNGKFVTKTYQTHSYIHTHLDFK